MKLIFHAAILAHYTFSKKYLNKFEEPVHFSMLESKLWCSKTVIKNVKGPIRMRYNKTCDQ